MSKFKIEIKREEQDDDEYQLWKRGNAFYVVDATRPDRKAVYLYHDNHVCPSHESNESIMRDGTRVTDPVTIIMRFNQ